MFFGLSKRRPRAPLAIIATRAATNRLPLKHPDLNLLYTASRRLTSLLPLIGYPLPADIMMHYRVERQPHRRRRLHRRRAIKNKSAFQPTSAIALLWFANNPSAIVLTLLSVHNDDAGRRVAGFSTIAPCCIDLALNRTLHFQREMRTRSVVIVEVRGQSPLQMTTVQDHEVIQALPSYRSDQALRVGTLPGTPRRGQHLLNPQRMQPPSAVQPIRTLGDRSH